ncbi:hypothetical protein [Streptomyces spectabilis]|uniref:DUF1963 domain-containing protein n=1 Tax=Streptomyces spectabilis TaxID=68270 RepID=A0A5P2X1W3_STRST|nr:hypothetical protein [Streptomyces spectabilis]MBB5101680.1 hypothetical protein [Streptomyces spectabilis]MCI3900862.1 hypothetical protein [Streptomyces spectabilis]QEV58378.1 hypothetical protein CP982_06390 [Streptomyces spectabilis]GGV49593.1 hypothetical protein GCM10010245_78000 [Streptomyces spectabilis]
MTTLLIHAGEAGAEAPGPRTGGVPLVPPGFAWPTCRDCGGALLFLLHLPLGAGTDGAEDGPGGRGDVVSVFLCQNDPGMCDDWDATGGANRAYLFAAEGLAPAAVPERGETRLGAVSALRTEEVAAAGFPEALDAWAADDAASLLVQGQLGGEPAWIQGDETPHCPGCAARMAFTAQVEEGYDFATSANFGGGGIGYVFHCVGCRDAAFLWQR